jgi:hypothetical protein
MGDRRERPRHQRQATRLRNGTIVVAEYDASGVTIRETYYYTADEDLVATIVAGRFNREPAPDQDH